MSPPAQTTDRRRRCVLKQAGGLSAALVGGLLTHRTAFPASERPAAATAAAFQATSLAEVLRSFGGVPQFDDAAIDLTVPESNENGAFVPVSIASRLPGTREIAIVVDGNPNPLVVRFRLAAGTEPFVSTRIRMARSGHVHAVVTTDGGLFGAVRHATVTVGACGA